MTLVADIIFELNDCPDQRRFLFYQSGFKPGDSCINQLLAITHNIYKSLDDGLEGGFS